MDILTGNRINTFRYFYCIKSLDTPQDAAQVAAQDAAQNAPQASIYLI